MIESTQVRFDPMSRLLEVELTLRPELALSVPFRLSTLEPHASVELFEYWPREGSTPGRAARIVLKARESVFDWAELWRVDPKRSTRQLPNGVSHGVGQELIEVSEASPLLGGPELLTYVDILREQWVGAAAVWHDPSESPLARGTTVWLPLRRDSRERVILSVAAYGPRGVPSDPLPEMRRSVIALFVDFKEFGRALGGGLVVPGQTPRQNSNRLTED